MKALLQVGETRTETYQTALGHPAELVPLANPYSLRAGPGTVVPVRALVGGQPAVQLVLQFGGRDARGERFVPLEVTTDASGVARIPVVRAGRWYVKFISMVRVAGDTSANYESRWATLTFEMR